MLLWKRRRRSPPTFPVWAYACIVLALLALKAAVLSVMGRPTICPCGFVQIWSGNVGGTDNSQHFADWYSASHLIFGMGLYWLLWKTSRHWPRGWLLVVVVASSVLWEIMENAPAIVERFAATGHGARYNGDSLVNSAGDTLFVVAGYFSALLLPVWAAAALAVALELAALWAVRDSLVLSLLMFLHPFAFIQAWQMGR